MYEVKKELEKAYDTIKSLESIISTQKGICHRCEIQAEETKNMLESIRCLEKEIEVLKS